jgi:hypothetical protein
MWQPISEAELWTEINHAVRGMTLEQRRLWAIISVSPSKWMLPPWGDMGAGFWVVAIFGNTVIWFNDIEDGFNRSQYSRFGVIDAYLCNRDQLQWTVQYVLDEIRTGQPSGSYVGPPEPLAEPPDELDSRQLPP